MRRSLATLIAASMLGGCATHASKPAQKIAPLAEPAPATYVRPCATPPADANAAFECDRRSILAMAGEFRVRFAFDETAALAPAYVPHDAQRSGGTELVEVVADDGRSIVLQHILVLGKEHVVVKHWRQDWRYEPDSLLQFRGNGRFGTRALAAAERTGQWSQTVYEVDDTPRYAGVGRWSHADGVDAWESGRVWRPLPRREYTKRTDYQALDVVNRHTLTPGGWVHEQDNTKIALDADGHTRALAREQGINSYTRTSGYDFSAGRAYWSKTAAYWADVRAYWNGYIVAHPRFSTSPEPNGELRIEAVFAQAERVENGENVPAGEISGLFDRYIHATD